MRHLKTLDVGPTDLIPLISANITALTDCPFRYRSLAFPSAADLFDVQSSFNHMIINSIRLKSFVKLTSFKSVVPPFCLPTKLDANPILHRGFTDFAPTLHRLWYGGRTKAQRIFKRPCTYPQIIKLTLVIFYVNIT